MSLKQSTKNGLNCIVPEYEYEDEIPKFDINQDSLEAIKFYKENGYVVLRKVIKKNDCDVFLKAWNNEVKPFKGYIYRQANAKLEKNIFNNKNWIMNPILNLQSLNSSYFYNLRLNFEKIIASNNLLANFIEKIIKDKPVIVQSMYFEGNSATWEHQDSYYLDDQETGKMIAGWLALEDIKADAGRFFVCPKSHLYDFASMDSSNIITKNHSGYVNKIVDIIKSNNLKIEAPKLDKGDILLWNSLTIHGSLNSQSETNSRSSITFHSIRTSSKFQVFRNIFRELDFDKKYAFNIFRPKDQNKNLNKFIFFIESNLPFIFYRLKNLAIEIKVKKNKKNK